MAILEFIYVAPPGGMSDLQVVSGHLGKSDKTAILREIDRDWPNLSVQDKGTYQFKLDGEKVGFTFESERDPENPREPKMRFKDAREFNTSVETLNDRPKGRHTQEPPDDLENVILAYTRRQKLNPDHFPGDVVAEIGKIVILLAQENEEGNRHALTGALRALGRKYPDVADVASLFDQYVQRDGGGFVPAWNAVLTKLSLFVRGK